MNFFFFLALLLIPLVGNNHSRSKWLADSFCYHRPHFFRESNWFLPSLLFSLVAPPDKPSVTAQCRCFQRPPAFSMPPPPPPPPPSPVFKENVRLSKDLSQGWAVCFPFFFFSYKVVSRGLSLVPPPYFSPKVLRLFTPTTPLSSCVPILLGSRDFFASFFSLDGYPE